MTDGVAVTPSTASTRQTIDTDEVTRGGQTVQQQVVKLSLGADGASDTLVDSGQQTSANSLPVVLPSDQTVAVSAASLPLPSGASTAAKQPALGTAGTASSDVLTVQGIASMTALVVDGSGVTQPVSDGGSTLSVDDGGGTLTVDGTVAVSGTVTVDTELPTAAALADATANPTTPLVAAAIEIFNGTTWDRVRGDTTNGIDVDVTRLPALAAGSNVIGALTANQSVNVAQMNGVTVTMGAGASGTGVQRVAIATDGQGQAADNAAFTDGTTRLDMGGFIFDEVAGTALTENDAAAARVDSKRAQVLVIEDATTRGQRATVSAAGAIKVDGSAVTQPVSVAATVSVNNSQIGGNAISAGNGASGTGVQRVTIASDSTGVVGLNAGSNLAGRVNLDPQTANGLSISRTISAATTNATSVKASAGQVYHLLVSNTNTSARYLKLYNKASAPTVGTDTPVMTILIPGSGGVALDVAAMGAAFGTGIALAMTTGVADSDTAAVAANEIVAHVLYK